MTISGSPGATYLLTPFTEPGELFGFYDLGKLHAHNVLERQERGMMQHADVVFLDEVFNASSAILNSLLTVINERVFHDRGTRKRVRMRCLFAATNAVPESPELRAFFDRFLLRCGVANVRGADQGLAERLGELIEVGWKETYGDRERPLDHRLLLEELAVFRRHVRFLTTKGALAPRLRDPDDPEGEQLRWAFVQNLAGRVVQAREYDLSEVSNRRVIKMAFVMLIHRLLRAVRDGDDGPLTLEGDELDLLHRFFLDRHDEDAERRMGRLTHPPS